MNRGIILLIFLSVMLACTQQTKMHESSALDDATVVENSIIIWEAKLFLKGDDQLGEGAIWNYKTSELWYIDIDGKKFKILDPSTKEQRNYQLKEKIGTVVPTSNKRAVVALESGLSYLDLDTQELVPIFNPNNGVVGMRSNDGKCDPMGRLWFGTMHMELPDKNGALYRVQADGKTELMLDSTSISNGIVWSLDSTRMYYTDTPNGYLRVFDYDAKSGDISNETKVGDFSAYGYPDGSTLDAEGMLWVCMWNGGKVLRMNPETGEVLGQIKVPAHNITSCAFGGTELDSLFITSAQVDMSEDEKKEYPDAGSVFVAVPGVKGVKSRFFGD